MKKKTKKTTRNEDWATKDAFPEFVRILQERGAEETGGGTNFTSYDLDGRTFYLFESPPDARGPYTGHWTEVEANEVIISGGFNPDSLETYLSHPRKMPPWVPQPFFFGQKVVVLPEIPGRPNRPGIVTDVEPDSGRVEVNIKGEGRLSCDYSDVRPA